MKRKVDLIEKGLESEKEGSGSSDSDSDDEEPRIKDVLSNLSQAVSKKRASDLLHSMAASRNILFWTPRGQLLRSKRIIPVTNIAELVEYVLLPHNDDVAKPRALNTFLDGLAELGVDKRLIKNKKLLSDLLEKEKCYRDENKASDESNEEESSSDSEDQMDELASENGSEAEEPQDSENDTESGGEESESGGFENTSMTQCKTEHYCEHCENSNVYETLIMKCPKCSWHDNYKICPICEHQIPLERKHSKEGFIRCYDCGAIRYDNLKASKTTFYYPSTDEDQDDD